MDTDVSLAPRSHTRSHRTLDSIPLFSIVSFTLNYITILIIAVGDLAHLTESGVCGVEGVAKLEDFNL